MSKCHLCPKESQYEYKENFFCADCISSVVVSEPASGPVKKKHRNKGKSFDEVTVNKNYSGEASPYWDYVMAKSGQTEEGQLFEPMEANPDILSEDDTPYKRSLTEEGELRLDVIRDVVEGLTPLQREVLAQCEEVDYTEERAAAQLKMTRRAFRTILNRIKKEIQSRYEQRQKSSPWQK